MRAPGVSPGGRASYTPRMDREGNGRRNPTIHILHGRSAIHSIGGALLAPPDHSLYIRPGPLCNQLIDSTFGPSRIVMINEVYNQRILELAADIPRLGRLGSPDATATAHSKLCGSTVTVDVNMDG